MRYLNDVIKSILADLLAEKMKSHQSTHYFKHPCVALSLRLHLLFVSMYNVESVFNILIAQRKKLPGKGIK